MYDGCAVELNRSRNSFDDVAFLGCAHRQLAAIFEPASNHIDPNANFAKAPVDLYDGLPCSFQILHGVSSAALHGVAIAIFEDLGFDSTECHACFAPVKVCGIAPGAPIGCCDPPHPANIAAATQLLSAMRPNSRGFICLVPRFYGNSGG
jgi:hypothetical protein